MTTDDPNDTTKPAATLTCALCGAPATIAPFPSGGLPTGDGVTSGALAIPAGVVFSTLVDRPYCAEHDPTLSLIIRAQLAQLRSDLTWTQSAAQSERDQYHGYRAEVARELGRLRSLLRAICDDAEVFGWDNAAIREARALLPDALDDGAAVESEEHAE